MKNTIFLLAALFLLNACSTFDKDVLINKADSLDFSANSIDSILASFNGDTIAYYKKEIGYLLFDLNTIGKLPEDDSLQRIALNLKPFHNGLKNFFEKKSQYLGDLDYSRKQISNLKHDIVNELAEADSIGLWIEQEKFILEELQTEVNALNNLTDEIKKFHHYSASLKGFINNEKQQQQLTGEK